MLGGCPTGQAKITKGYKLKAKFVIHTPGPVFYEENEKECEMLLRGCYKNSIRLAKENGCKSMAFPLISAGVYGYPKYDALKVAVSVIEKYASDLDVYLVLFDREAFEIAKETYMEYLSPVSREEKENIEAFAKYHGFDRFEQRPDWEGQEVYHIWKENMEGAFTGYPHFALRLNGELRMATHEEVLEIMKIKR